tara:strand:+ start:674 stop:1324 length:651 start_codon:yes stop_codon:yes gene_type:complete
MTYDELKVNIQDIVENSFTDEQLAMFTEQAEQKIFNTVQLPSLRKNVTGILSASNKYLSAPVDFLSVFSLAVIDAAGRYEFLLNKDVNFIRQAYPTPTSLGLPRYYAIFGPNSNDATELSLIVGPTPDAAYDVELHYFYYPESIVTAGQSWLGDNFDSALLNGALIEALRFIKGEGDMIAMYDKLYLQAITLLKQLGDGKMRQDSYRSGQFRQNVS